MKKTRICSAILCAVILSVLLPTTASAAGADAVTEVSTVAELRAALENDAGAHVRLTKDIIFTRANAADKHVGVYPGRGSYTIDLNSHTIKYHYIPGGEFSDQGDVINIGGDSGTDTRMLVVNGPGSIIGGITGIKAWSNRSILIVNGGTIRGIMGHGIAGGGIIYINGGTVIGNFGSIEYESGIVVLNGGEVKRVNYRPMSKQMEQEYGYGIISNGVLNGHAVLSRTVLDVTNLTISEGSSLKVKDGGGLIVRNSFVNKGTFTYESGLKSIGGEATVKKSPDGNHQWVEISFDMSFSSLDIQERADLRIGNGATVTVTGAFSTGRDGNVGVENGTLRLLGSIDHKGRSEGIPELAALEDRGGSSGSGQWRNYDKEMEAAHRLREFGLFQGIGTNPDGGIEFALERYPTRVEALVMLIRLLGKENEAKNGDWKHPFTDVPGWADKYVGYAYEKGLTKGVSSAEFGTGTASVQMYLTFVLRALGYSDAAGGDFTWNAPERFAQGVGVLAEGVYMEDFRRADVVIISEAALSAMLKNSQKTLLDKLIEDGAVMMPDNNHNNNSNNNNSELINALTAPGLASVTLTGDVTIDMTGIEINGGKEIILNDFSLTLTGEFRVTEDVYLDVYPGEGLTGGSIDMTNLRFDLSHLPEGLTGEIPLMEIHPVTMAGLPQQGGGIVINETSGNLIVITCVVGQ